MWTGKKGLRVGPLALGALLLAFGAFLAIERIGGFVGDAAGRGWPLVRIGLGLFLAWLAMTGTALAAGAMQFLVSTVMSPWPYLLSLLGLALIWRAATRVPHES